MGIVKQAADLVYTFRFLRLLTTQFEETEAFKAGIIDAEGKRNKAFDLSNMENREKYNNYYTPFHRLVFNIKKLLAKAPGGGSRLASYAAALFLLKEKYGVPEKKIEKALELFGLDVTDFMLEDSKWFLLEDGRLSPGMYKVRHNKVVNSTMDELVNPREYVKISENCYPVGSMFGINIYEATHVKTQQKVYVTIAELSI